MLFEPCSNRTEKAKSKFRLDKELYSELLLGIMYYLIVEHLHPVKAYLP